MKHYLNKTVVLTALALGSGEALAHAGSHGGQGLMVSLVHLLGQHGYLLAVVLCGLGAIALQRA